MRDAKVKWRDVVRPVLRVFPRSSGRIPASARIDIDSVDFGDAVNDGFEMGLRP
jgi:hypothetical protein